jgi:RNA polymerase sigma factor (sigma-70 family)
MTSDAKLLQDALTDSGAFRDLYDRYAERVYGFHLRRSGSPDAAHDLTAETFAQAWLSRATFRDEAGGSAAPWLFGIARHVLSASVRRRRLERAACTKLGVFERLDREPAATEPDATWLDGLDDALATLPEGQRRALELRYEQDLSYECVAEALSTTPQAARVRVHRGLATLRGLLTPAKETRP